LRVANAFQRFLRSLAGTHRFGFHFRARFLPHPCRKPARGAASRFLARLERSASLFSAFRLKTQVSRRPLLRAITLLHRFPLAPFPSSPPFLPLSQWEEGELRPNYFAGQFKRATGLPLHQYVILRRVERARQLLQTGSDFSLAEVAAHAGFSDQSQFSHHFKRTVGVTPGQFQTPARIA
jgi:hypothetical protein